MATLPAMPKAVSRPIPHPLQSIRKIGAATLGFLVPPLCPLCNSMTGGRGICHSCWQGLRIATSLACRSCARLFEHDGGHHTCPSCMTDPPAFDRAVAALVYNDAARTLILALKHGDRLDIAPVLARLMLPTAAPLLASADMVIPLPLHPRRFRARRFNQSAEIARHLLDVAAMPPDILRPDILLRRRDTPSQGRMTRSGRRRNMRGAFALAGDCKDSIRGKTLLLIDDVLTTGASLDAAASCLKRSGAKSVGVAVAAKVDFSQKST